MLAEEALAALRLGDGAEAPGRVALARFFAEQVAVHAPGLATSVMDGAATMPDAALPDAAA
jgi:hypothetical protein